MKRAARLAGLGLSILSAIAFLVAGAPLPTAPEPPDPAVTGAAVAEAVAGQGVELPEGFDLAALGDRVAAAMPAEPNIGTASALGKNIAEFVTEAGGDVPEGVADAQLGAVTIGVTGQLRAALAGEAEWGPTLWAIGGLLSGLLMAWFGWERKTKVTTLSCVLGLGLVLGGCANQTCPDGMSTTIRAGTAGGVWSRCDGDPDSRISLTAEGRNILYALCGPGERPGGIEPIEVEGGMRWLLTCVDVDGTEREVVR